MKTKRAVIGMGLLIFSGIITIPMMAIANIITEITGSDGIDVMAKMTKFTPYIIVGLIVLGIVFLILSIGKDKQH